LERMLTKIVAVVLLLKAVSCQDDELSDADVKNLQTAGVIPIEEAMRCGLFFAKNEIGLPPIETLFVIKATWPAPECPVEGRVERAIDHCRNLWKKLVKKLNFKDKSLKGEKAEAGATIGDDICDILKKKGVVFAGKRSKRFPKGLQVGFFANMCGNKVWEDTGDRHSELVCCAKGKHVDCP